jgi:hypothetical protein
MRVLVCGGRDFVDCGLLLDTLDALDALAKREVIDCLIEGDARGADRIAGAWAKRRRVDLKLFPAGWNRHGRAAGHIRDQEMLDKGEPDLVVSFPGGAGTADMVRRAQAAGIKVIKVANEE